MKIALVNDLGIALDALRRVLALVPQHQIVWEASNGADAVRRCAKDRPDLILMDLIMPVMDGVEATRRIMAATPCAILVVTASVDATIGHVYDALGAGALDAVNTPGFNGEGETGFLSKIDMIRRLIGELNSVSSGKPAVLRDRETGEPSLRLIALGASAGGPAALAAVLKEFPRHTTAAFVAVQHLDESFAVGLTEWLGEQISLPVRLVHNGDRPMPGVVLLPGRDDHLLLTAQGTLVYRREPANYVYRPSVDVFFESVARHWPGSGAGVLLTGMGRDGAIGLKQMREARFPTIAQDRATCTVYGMPKAAAELGAAERILPLDRIGPALRQLLDDRVHANHLTRTPTTDEPTS